MPKINKDTEITHSAIVSNLGEEEILNLSKNHCLNFGMIYYAKDSLKYYIASKDGQASVLFSPYTLPVISKEPPIDTYFWLDISSIPYILKYFNGIEWIALKN